MVTKRKNKEKSENSFNSRLIKIGIFSLVIWIYVFGRLAYQSLIKGESLSLSAQEEWRSEIGVGARRGDIVDRNGVPIVTSANVYRLDFDLNSFRQYIEDEELEVNDVAKKISDVTKIPLNEVLEIINTKDANGELATFANLSRGVEKAVADEIKKLDIYGLMVGDDVKRYYPNGNFLAHTLGSINSEGSGLTGIELEYNKHLTGVPGMKIQANDARTNKMPFAPFQFTPPIDGGNVELTIDTNLQYFAEQVAEKGLKENKAKRVSILLMDPNNGEILAMASKPDYDPNKPFDGSESYGGQNESEKLQSMWRNNLVSDTFEPGSTFKTISMIAAMQENVVSDKDTFVCNGHKDFNGHKVHCWDLDGHGTQTLSDILKNSCNVGFMELGERLGAAKLNEYIYKLGFGKPTGIDLPGEAEGIVKDEESISEMDLGTIAFGQTNSVTIMQLMTAFNAIANGGDLIQPHVLKKITHESRDGEKIVDETFEPRIKKDVLDEEKTAELRGYLEKTATQNDTTGPFVEGYDIGIKTGTAQKVDTATGGYSDDKYIASIVGISPVENPRISMFLMVDEPSAGKYYGGQVASPLAKDLFKRIFKYLDSPHGQEVYSISKDIIIPNLRGRELSHATNSLDEIGLSYEIEGKGQSIVSMEPYPGTKVEEGTKIKLVTTGSSMDKNIMIPDLKGKTPESVKILLEQLGIKYEIVGEGLVYNQNIGKGTVVEAGTTIKLTLKKESEY